MTGIVEWLNRCGALWWQHVVPATCQATLVAVVVFAIVGATRRVSSPLRYGVLLLALLKFAVPPMLAFPTGMFSHYGFALGTPSGAEPLPDLFQGMESPDSGMAIGSAGADRLAGRRAALAASPAGDRRREARTAFAAVSALIGSISWVAGLMLVHALGAACFAGWLLKERFRLFRCSALATPVTAGPLFRLYESLGREVGLRRPPRLLISADSLPPMAFGVFAPAVLIPASLASDLSSARLRAVLAHELAHHYRRDPLISLLQSLLLVVWWFNPVFWALNWIIRRVREDCCDDLLLVRGIASGENYCESLLQAGRDLVLAPRSAHALGFAEHLHPLGRRLRRIMDARIRRAPRISPAGWLAVLSIGLLALPGMRGRAAEPLRTPDASAARAGLRAESFETDPGWERFGEHAMGVPAKQTVQDFGWRATQKAGGAAPGEIGGTISRSVTPAWYARKIATKTLNDKLSASGRFAVTRSDSSSAMLFGFFNDNSRGWRANNSMVMRFSGEAGSKDGPETKRDPYCWIFYEYGTRNWRAGGGAAFEGIYQTTEDPPLKSDGRAHEWSLEYDPDGANGGGEIHFVLDGRSFNMPLADGYKEEGAEFNRFGLLNAQVAGSSMEVFFDDVIVNGEAENFADGEGWEGAGNQVTFEDRDVRPYHDLFWSETNHAGGKPGELALTMWRNESPAYFGDVIEPVTLDNELHAQGRLAFTGAGSDSGVFLGWFNAEAKRAKTDPDAAHKGEKSSPQTSLLAIGIEGPSRIGHYFHPYYTARDGEMRGRADAGPIIRPDGRQRRWTLDYDPTAADGRGRVTVTLDEEKVELELKPGARASGATFDRFGFFNSQSGGHYVKIFIDDLKYTAAPPAAAAKAE